MWTAWPDQPCSSIGDSNLSASYAGARATNLGEGHRAALIDDAGTAQRHGRCGAAVNPRVWTID